MTRIIITTLLMCGLGVTAQHNLSATSWSVVAHLPGGKIDDGSGFSLNDALYFGCGIDEFWNLRNDWYRYSAKEDSWQQMPALPAEPRQYATAFANSTTGYVCGGDLGNGVYSNACFHFDSETEQWERIANTPWSPRCAATYFVSGNAVYFFGGRNAQLKFNDLWRFDFTSEQWDSVGILPFSGRDEMVAFSHQHFGYALLGRDTGNVPHNDMWEFNALTEEWTKLNDFPGRARIYASAVSTAMGGLVAGGEDESGKIINESFYFSAGTKTWTALDTLAAGDVRGMELIRLENNYFTFGGITHSFTRIDEVQRISLGEFSSSESGRILAVFPNPARDRVVVSSSRNEPWISSIILRNTSGLLLKRKDYNGVLSGGQLSVANLSAGVYFIEAIGMGRSERIKLIVYN